MYRRNYNSWTKHIDFLIIDLCCVNAAFGLAWLARFGADESPYADVSYRALIILLSVLFVTAAFVFSIYHRVLKRGYMAELTNSAGIMFISLALALVVLYAIKESATYSRLFVFYMCVIFVAMDYPARLALKRYLKNGKRGRSSKARKVFAVSDSENLVRLIESIDGDKAENLCVAAYSVSGTQNGTGLDAIGKYECVPLSEASEYICRSWIDEVFACVTESNAEVREFLSNCAEMGVTVHIVMNIRQTESTKQFMETLDDRPVFTSAYSYIAPHQAVIKRLFDILAGIIGSVIATVIIALLGPVIFCIDPGPVIFRQERVGQNGKRFRIYKLRSMYLDAESRKKDYEDCNIVSDGMMFKMENDPRILPGIGEFIRRTSLDEYPQFFNVLKGEMSVVGTRPPTVDEWEKYKYHHRARLAMKPGITGMWQVSGRSDITDFEQVVELDTYYITHFRLSLDIKILLKTVPVVLRRKGAE